MSDLIDETMQEQRQELRAIAQSFRQSQIILTCVELGIFEILTDGALSGLEVAQRLGGRHAWDTSCCSMLLRRLICWINLKMGSAIPLWQQPVCCRRFLAHYSAV